MSKREKQVVEVQVYGDSISMDTCMCMLVTIQKKNYGEIFPKIVREKFSEKLDGKGLSFSMIYIL